MAAALICVRCKHAKLAHDSNGCKDWNNLLTGEPCKCTISDKESGMFLPG